MEKDGKAPELSKRRLHHRNDDDNGKSCVAKIVITDSRLTADSLPFEDRCQALSYPDAKRRDAARGAGASHLVDQRRGQAGAAAT
jgi:hypothetical protein